MSEPVKIVMDAMGGDFAPAEPVKAAVAAVRGKDKIQGILTGKRGVIEQELLKNEYPGGKIQNVHTSEGF